MTDKPTTAAGYRSEQVDLVRETCLYVATKLGDLMDELVVIGGLVPSLLIDQTDLSEGMDAHVGTMDLDVGLTLALLEEGKYRTLTERLRRAGFVEDTNEEGNPTRQRWKIKGRYGAGIDDIASRLRPLLDDPMARKAIEILKQDFATHDDLGPRRVAEFIRGAADDEIQADVVGFVGQLLDRCEQE